TNSSPPSFLLIANSANRYPSSSTNCLEFSSDFLSWRFCEMRKTLTTTNNMQVTISTRLLQFLVMVIIGGRRSPVNLSAWFIKSALTYVTINSHVPEDDSEGSWQTHATHPAPELQLPPLGQLQLAAPPGAHPLAVALHAA